MPIDSKTDELFRELTGHAIHNRLDELARVIAQSGEKAYGQVVVLALQATAHLCVAGAARWPTAADLRETARIASEAKTGLPITADDIHAYLSRSVFGSEDVLTVFKGNEDAPVIPWFALANLVVSFKPPLGEGWNSWFDVIENAIEIADQVPVTAAPTIVFRYLKGK